jgi:protein-disulfide isomerase
MAAAEVAECAGRMGRFWEMYGLLFSAQGKLDADTLAAYADKLGLKGSIQACLETNPAVGIRAGLSDANRFGIFATPGFLLGRRNTRDKMTVVDRVTGARPLGQFEEMIQRALDGLNSNSLR